MIVFWLLLIYSLFIDAAQISTTNNVIVPKDPKNSEIAKNIETQGKDIDRIAASIEERGNKLENEIARRGETIDNAAAQSSLEDGSREVEQLSEKMDRRIQEKGKSIEDSLAGRKFISLKRDGKALSLNANSVMDLAISKVEQQGNVVDEIGRQIEGYESSKNFYRSIVPQIFSKSLPLHLNSVEKINNLMRSFPHVPQTRHVLPIMSAKITPRDNESANFVTVHGRSAEESGTKVIVPLAMSRKLKLETFEHLKRKFPNYVASMMQTLNEDEASDDVQLSREEVQRLVEDEQICHEIDNISHTKNTSKNETIALIASQGETKNLSNSQDDKTEKNFKDSEIDSVKSKFDELTSLLETTYGNDPYSSIGMNTERKKSEQDEAVSMRDVGDLRRMASELAGKLAQSPVKMADLSTVKRNYVARKKSQKKTLLRKSEAMNPTNQRSSDKLKLHKHNITHKHLTNTTNIHKHKTNRKFRNNSTDNSAKRAELIFDAPNSKLLTSSPIKQHEDGSISQPKIEVLPTSSLADTMLQVGGDTAKAVGGGEGADILTPTISPPETFSNMAALNMDPIVRISVRQISPILSPLNQPNELKPQNQSSSNKRDNSQTHFSKNEENDRTNSIDNDQKPMVSYLPVRHSEHSNYEEKAPQEPVDHSNNNAAPNDLSRHSDQFDKSNQQHSNKPNDRNNKQFSPFAEERPTTDLHVNLMPAHVYEPMHFEPSFDEKQNNNYDGQDINYLADNNNFVTTENSQLGTGDHFDESRDKYRNDNLQTRHEFQDNRQPHDREEHFNHVDHPSHDSRNDHHEDHPSYDQHNDHHDDHASYDQHNDQHDNHARYDSHDDRNRIHQEDTEDLQGPSTRHDIHRDEDRYRNNECDDPPKDRDYRGDSSKSDREEKSDVESHVKNLHVTNEDFKPSMDEIDRRENYESNEEPPPAHPNDNDENDHNRLPARERMPSPFDAQRAGFHNDQQERPPALVVQPQEVRGPPVPFHNIEYHANEGPREFNAYASNRQHNEPAHNSPKELPLHFDQPHRPDDRPPHQGDRPPPEGHEDRQRYHDEPREQFADRDTRNHDDNEPMGNHHHEGDDRDHDDHDDEHRYHNSERPRDRDVDEAHKEISRSRDKYKADDKEKDDHEDDDDNDDEDKDDENDSDDDDDDDEDDEDDDRDSKKRTKKHKKDDEDDISKQPFTEENLERKANEPVDWDDLAWKGEYGKVKYSESGRFSQPRKYECMLNKMRKSQHEQDCAKKREHVKKNKKFKSKKKKRKRRHKLKELSVNTATLQPTESPDLVRKVLEAPILHPPSSELKAGSTNNSVIAANKRHMKPSKQKKGERRTIDSVLSLYRVVHGEDHGDIDEITAKERESQKRRMEAIKKKASRRPDQSVVIAVKEKRLERLKKKEEKLKHDIEKAVMENANGGYLSADNQRKRKEERMKKFQELDAKFNVADKKVEEEWHKLEALVAESKKLNPKHDPAKELKPQLNTFVEEKKKQDKETEEKALHHAKVQSEREKLIKMLAEDRARADVEKAVEEERRKIAERRKEEWLIEQARLEEQHREEERIKKLHKGLALHVKYKPADFPTHELSHDDERKISEDAKPNIEAVNMNGNIVLSIPHMDDQLDHKQLPDEHVTINAVQSPPITNISPSGGRAPLTSTKDISNMCKGCISNVTEEHTTSSQVQTYTLDPPNKNDAELKDQKPSDAITQQLDGGEFGDFERKMEEKEHAPESSKNEKVEDAPESNKDEKIEELIKESKRINGGASEGKETLDNLENLQKSENADNATIAKESEKVENEEKLEHEEKEKEEKEEEEEKKPEPPKIENGNIEASTSPLNHNFYSKDHRLLSGLGIYQISMAKPKKKHRRKKHRKKKPLKQDASEENLKKHMNERPTSRGIPPVEPPHEPEPPEYDPDHHNDDADPIPPHQWLVHISSRDAVGPGASPPHDTNTQQPHPHEAPSGVPPNPLPPEDFDIHPRPQPQQQIKRIPPVEPPAVEDLQPDHPHHDSNHKEAQQQPPHNMDVPTRPFIETMTSTDDVNNSSFIDLNKPADELTETDPSDIIKTLDDVAKSTSSVATDPTDKSTTDLLYMNGKQVDNEIHKKFHDKLNRKKTARKRVLRSVENAQALKNGSKRSYHLGRKRFHHPRVDDEDAPLVHPFNGFRHPSHPGGVGEAETPYNEERHHKHGYPLPLHPPVNAPEEYEGHTHMPLPYPELQLAENATYDHHDGRHHSDHNPDDSYYEGRDWRHRSDHHTVIVPQQKADSPEHNLGEIYSPEEGNMLGGRHYEVEKRLNKRNYDDDDIYSDGYGVAKLSYLTEQYGNDLSRNIEQGVRDVEEHSRDIVDKVNAGVRRVTHLSNLVQSPLYDRNGDFYLPTTTNRKYYSHRGHYDEDDD